MGIERQDSFSRMIGERTQIARKEKGWTQEQLSDRLGFKDRQILSNIESGRRKISSDELMALIKHLDKDLDYFTDPLRLVGEGAFCWRANAGIDILTTFEEKAKGWIAFYRAMGGRLTEPFSPLTRQLTLTSESSYEEAQERGEELAREWGLGEIPSRKLVETAEKELRILLLYVDPPGDISGAACHLKEFGTIIVNRNDPVGRRAYDVAHELFHLLTWTVMPPEHLDRADSSRPRVRRAEQLANNFASALLMPRTAVTTRWSARTEKDVHRRINRLAEDFGVTADALYWRLRSLALLDDGEAVKIVRSRLTWNGGIVSKQDQPKLFSKPFVDRLWKGLMKGLISERRAAHLLDTTFEDLTELFKTYGMESPLEI